MKELREYDCDLIALQVRASFYILGKLDAFERAGGGDEPVPQPLPARDAAARLLGRLLAQVARQDDERRGQEVRRRLRHLLERQQVRSCRFNSFAR